VERIAILTIVGVLGAYLLHYSPRLRPTIVGGALVASGFLLGMSGMGDIVQKEDRRAVLRGQRRFGQKRKYKRI
jgi:hypothetical protein